MNRRLIAFAALAVAATSFVAFRVSAHCQVPCGIYDESARIKQLKEDAATIEKAMNQMSWLAGKTDAQSRQQFVRWVNTKEAHAEQIMTTVADYFMAQRVKPEFANDDVTPTPEYARSLAELHGVMIAAMKCKQSADVATVKTLRDAIHVVEHRWAPDHDHTH